MSDTPVDDRWTQHISTIKGAQPGQGHRVQGVSSVQGVEVDTIVVVVVDVVVDIVVVGVEAERLDHHSASKLPGTPWTPREPDDINDYAQLMTTKRYP